LSTTKAYYVKSIVKPFPRGDYELRTPGRLADSNAQMKGVEA